MKRIFLAAALALVPASLDASAQRRGSSERKSFALVHVTIVDVGGAPPARDMTVVVADGRIAAVGRRNKVRAPRGARLIDASGKFLIPGLWDMHAHLGDDDFDREAHLPLFIANGVTGIRLMSGSPEHHRWRSEIEGGTRRGPRMFIASGDMDESQTSEAAAREAARGAALAGADFFKVYDGLPRASYFALVEEARRLGLPVAGHVPASLTAAEVSEAGQKSIEHLTGLGEAKTDDAKAAALFAVFRKNRTWQCPTLIMRHNYASLDEARLAEDPRLRYVKPSWRERWLRMSRESANAPRGEWAARRETVRREKRLVGMMQRAGVRLLAGTDDANPYSFPGFSLHDELSMLVEAGLTPRQALRAATTNAAEFLGRLDSLGSVAAGRLADLVLLDADPLEDIDNTRRIYGVVVRGRFLDRTDLNRMLAEVEAAGGRK